MSFFNFNNAITAAYFADQDLKIQKVNANFAAFFPYWGMFQTSIFPMFCISSASIKSRSNLFQKSLRRMGMC